MDVEEDSIYVTPAPRVGSNSAKRRPVARMHASRASNALKSLKLKRKNPDPRCPVPPRPRRAIANDMEVRMPGWTVKHMGGKCPPFNDNAGWIHDPSNRRMYAYGGLAPGDESQIPTSDFYVCDTTTMAWRNITNSLKFRDPYNPFSQDARRGQLTPLPQLTEPGCTILRVHNSSFIFIFGGYNIEEDAASSKTIVVDLDQLEWWYLQIEGGGVEARIEPVVVAIDTKMYIFGGYKQLDHEDPQPCNSYSVAEFLDDQRWHWTVRDQPYSNIVPEGHLFGKAISVYNGAKILLTPGRVSSNHIQFKEDNLFYYHIAKKKFQLVDITGDFPKDVLWYSIHEYQALPPAIPTTFTPSRSPVMPRGRPRKTPSNQQSTSNTISTTQATVSAFASSPSLIICAWIPLPETPHGDAAPELWHLFLTPDERIDRLNIAQQVLQLNHDFQGFICVDEKMRLMGYDDGRMDTGEDDESEVEVDPNAKWNIFLDVPMPNGK